MSAEVNRNILQRSCKKKLKELGDNAPTHLVTKWLDEKRVERVK